MFTRMKLFLALSVVLVFAAATASADFKLERRLALEPGGTFILETDIGEVVLTGDSTSGATVNVTSGRDDLDQKYDFRFEEVAGGATVTVKRRGGWLSGWFDGGWFGNRTRFDVHVPMKTTVNVSTSGGGINVSKITGHVGVRTSGGGLRIEAVEGDVNGSTSGGGVRMRDVRGNAVARTSGGGCGPCERRVRELLQVALPRRRSRRRPGKRSSRSISARRNMKSSIPR